MKLITTIGVTIFHRRTLRSPSLHAAKCRKRNSCCFFACIECHATCITVSTFFKLLLQLRGADELNNVTSVSTLCLLS